MGVPILPREGAILGKGSPILKYSHFLPWAVQKRLNRSICRLGCGLGCAAESTSSLVLARWRQCALLCGHIGVTWQIRLNRPSASAMRSYVKLLWPLVKNPENRPLPSFSRWQHGVVATGAKSLILGCLICKMCISLKAYASARLDFSSICYILGLLC